MPELPEVEVVRRGLMSAMPGRRVVDVTLHRPQIVAGSPDPAGLLLGRVVQRIERHGKNLAIFSTDDDGPVVHLHLGMTGRVDACDADQPDLLHTHLVWRLDDGRRIRFTDPRRFGGVTPLPHADQWRQLIARLGPDALTITARQLLPPLLATRRNLKAALLDQTVIAGLGNIYCDELCHRARISPLSPAQRVTLPRLQSMVRQMRQILRRAIRLGGSTYRDYRNVAGQPGSYQQRHQVYGHGGEPCPCCQAILNCEQVAGRTTVWCRRCQKILR